MLSVSILRDPGGAPLYYIAQIEDITERKRVEKELRDANAFLDAIIENIPLMLFIKESASLRFVRFNRAGEDLLGWPRQSLVGKNDFDFWPPEQAEFFVQKDRETMKSGKVVDIDEEPIQTRHQGVRILHTKKVPILDPSGNPLYLLGISEDITERRRIEKERRLLAEVSVALSASLDYEQTLATVAQLAVHSVADWCVIDVVEEHGHIRRLKVASADPANAALCAVLEQMPPNRDLPYLVRSVVESRRSVRHRARDVTVPRVACAGAGTPASPPGHRPHVAHRGAALDAGEAPRRVAVRLLEPGSRLRAGRSSLGRSSG